MNQFRHFNGMLIPADQDASDSLRGLQDQELVDCNVKRASSLTGQQMKAIHLWCGMVASAFNQAGIMRRVEIPGLYEIETDWSKEAFKRDVWYTVQEAIVGTSTVKKLERKQVDEIYRTIDRDILSPQGIHIPFPNWRDIAK